MGKTVGKTGDRTYLTVTNIAVKLSFIYLFMVYLKQMSVFSEQTVSKNTIINELTEKGVEISIHGIIRDNITESA
jgi:hypothetical protein